MRYYEAFINNPNDCCSLVATALNESYHWLSQSFEESKSITCSFREHVNGYELSCLSDLVKASVEVNGGGVKIAFRGFVFVPEHVSGSEMSFFNIIYELGENGEKLYFDNPLRDPCKTMRVKISMLATLDVLIEISDEVNRVTLNYSRS